MSCKLELCKMHKATCHLTNQLVLINQLNANHDTVKPVENGHSKIDKIRS